MRVRIVVRVPESLLADRFEGDPRRQRPPASETSLSAALDQAGTETGAPSQQDSAAQEDSGQAPTEQADTEQPELVEAYNYLAALNTATEAHPEQDLFLDELAAEDEPDEQEFRETARDTAEDAALEELEQLGALEELEEAAEPDTAEIVSGTLVEESVEEDDDFLDAISGSVSSGDVPEDVALEVVSEEPEAVAPEEEFETSEAEDSESLDDLIEDVTNVVSEPQASEEELAEAEALEETSEEAEETEEAAMETALADEEPAEIGEPVDDEDRAAALDALLDELAPQSLLEGAADVAGEPDVETETADQRESAETRIADKHAPESEDEDDLAAWAQRLALAEEAPAQDISGNESVETAENETADDLAELEETSGLSAADKPPTLTEEEQERARQAAEFWELVRAEREAEKAHKVAEPDTDREAPLEQLEEQQQEEEEKQEQEEDLEPASASSLLAFPATIDSTVEAEDTAPPSEPGDDEFEELFSEPPEEEDPETIYSWSAYDRPKARVMVPLSEQAYLTRRRKMQMFLAAAAVVAVVSVGWFYKQQTDPIRALEALDSGQREFRVGSYPQAIVDVNRAIAINPDLVDAYLLRARSAVAMGRTEEALPDFAQTIQRRPNYTTAYLERGLAYFNIRLYREALSDAEQALSIDSEFADAYTLRGMTLRELGQPQEALADFDRAVQLKPTMSNYIQRGALFQMLERHEEAIDDFSQAIYLNPGSPQPYFARAQSLRALGDMEAADLDHTKARYLDHR